MLTHRARLCAFTTLLPFTPLACDLEDDVAEADFRQDSSGSETDHAELLAASDESIPVEPLDYEPLEPAEGMELSTPEAQPYAANSSTRLNDCEWERYSFSSTLDGIALCDADMRPISGGCYNSDSAADIVRNHPIENYNFTTGSYGLPEIGEKWYETDGSSAADLTGWRCKRSSTAGTMEAFALCCG